jgi:hypothetical protein
LTGTFCFSYVFTYKFTLAGRDEGRRRCEMRD